MRKIFVVGLVALVLSLFEAWAQNQARPERITHGPIVKQTTEDSAEISWSTDAAGSSIVKYGTAPNALTETAEKPWGGTHEGNGQFDHTVWVKNLRPHTTYYFMVEIGQGRGTGTEAESRIGRFATK
jgi:hypothetical protein